jgi:ribosomal protein S18 acetylase RimI-like enzyme
MPDSPRPLLRRATPADAEALAALKLATFRETFLEDFAIPYPADDLSVFVAENYALEPVAAEIADPAHATWVCEDADGTLLAYAHVCPCRLPHPEVHERSGELSQIYVRRAAQGLGLGRRLLQVSIDWLGETYPGPVWLGVWSGNHRGQAVYAALGFRKVGDYQFKVGNHRDDEYIFRRD